MSLWTSSDIANATGGETNAEFSVTGLSIDTRTLQKGDLFVAIKDVRDGHDFISQAIKAGASGVLAEKLVDDAPTVVVKDTMAALEALGQASRERSRALRIGVTGSVGKTSVKEALSTMFSIFGSTHKSQKSFNNHLGAPITLAAMPEDTEYGVFELGMNHAGELRALSNQVRPNIALITNVFGAHLANFENVEAIARAKAEIIEGLEEGGTVILNGDNEHTPLIKALAGDRNILTFGYEASNDVVIVSTNSHAMGGNVRLRVGYQQIDVTLAIPGEHWFSNAAACMAVAKAADIDLRKAAMALRKVGAAQGRGDAHSLSLGGKPFTLIDESYNANPTSMRAAFSAAALKQGRKVAILGDMGELGADELEFHAGLAKPLEEAGFDRVIVKGESMRALRGALPQKLRAAWTETIDDAFEALKHEIQEGDVLLVKGSNAAQLGQLVQRLKEGV